jgi:heat shock protein 4
MSKEIIGINVGSKNTIIGTYEKGRFKIIPSGTSSRTIPTVISFSGLERTFGETALNKNRANYKSTIIYPNRWFGMKKNYPFFEYEAKFANISPIQNPLYSGNLIGFNINIEGNKIFYLPEEIMGAFFSKIKSIWLNNNINTNNIVISIPDYSTVQERKAMLDSLYISGLDCIALLNESSAISINYAFQKMKEFENNKRTVAFIDLGHSQLTIFYAEFTKESINILSVTSERFCGARDLDYLIAEKLSYEFQKKYGIDLLDSPKAKISLMNAVNKARKNLTVNKDETISIDEIIKGKDLVDNLTRENMEQIIQPIISKFKNICKNSIIKAEKVGVNINNLYSVEMVGDTLRTPCITQIIKNIYKKDLSKTLIPDECISRGCCLFAMMNSPHYLTQNFSIRHYNPYPIFLECQGKDVKVFSEGDKYPSTKMVKIPGDVFDFSRQEIYIRIVYQNIPELNYLKDKVIQEYKIILPYPNNIKITKIELLYDLDINCLPKLFKATMYNSFNNVMNLNFELIKENFGLSKDSLDYLKFQEIERDKKDLIIKESITYKNSLEEYIYNTRDKMDKKGQFEGYYTPQEKEKLIDEMDKLMKWLYSDDKDIYNIIKLEQNSLPMKSISEPIYSRYNEWKQLNEQYNIMKQLITEKTSYYTSLEDKIKKGEVTDININLDKISKIQQIIQQEFNNLEVIIYQTDKEQKIKMPSIKSNDVQNLINKFNKKIENILK